MPAQALTRSMTQRGDIGVGEGRGLLKPPGADDASPLHPFDESDVLAKQSWTRIGDMRSVVLVCSLATLIVPAAAQARSSCEARAQDRRVAGAVLGAVGGTIIGN